MTQPELNARQARPVEIRKSRGIVTQGDPHIDLFPLEGFVLGGIRLKFLGWQKSRYLLLVSRPEYPEPVLQRLRPGRRYDIAGEESRFLGDHKEGYEGLLHVNYVSLFSARKVFGS